jgi:hypothetical protein
VLVKCSFVAILARACLHQIFRYDTSTFMLEAMKPAKSRLLLIRGKIFLVCDVQRHVFVNSLGTIANHRSSKCLCRCLESGRTFVFPAADISSIGYRALFCCNLGICNVANESVGGSTWEDIMISKPASRPRRRVHPRRSRCHTHPARAMRPCR